MKIANRITRMLPSMVTLGNTACGFLAVAYIAEERFLAAAYMILLAMIFDALDGQVARLTRQASDFGEQLDSLSDIITFGVAPAFLVKVFVLMESSLFKPKVAWLLSALYCICAVIRLARFNVENSADESSHQTFKGLPTPAAAGTIAGLVIAHETLSDSGYALLNILPTLLPLIAAGLGLLMVSRITYPHAISRLLHGSLSVWDFLPYIVLIALACVAHEVAIAAGFTAYALSGPMRILLSRMHLASEDFSGDKNRSFRE